MRLFILSILFFLLSLSGLDLRAQGSPLLGKFSVSQYQGSVSLYWQIVAGSTCNGIQIYRSTDSLNFERVGYIPGICGSVFEETNYFFTDSMPVPNTVNYYYLELGSVGTSDVLSVNVISSSAGYQIRPHPIVGQGTIFFDAIAGTSYELRVYDINGSELLYEESSENFFVIETTSIPSGSYVFTIISRDQNSVINGVLLVQ